MHWQKDKILNILTSFYICYLQMAPSQYFVHKDVQFGREFVEHIYPRNDENFLGLWRKVGHLVDRENQGTWEYLCSACQRDYRTRTHLVNPNSNLITRSYKVEGFTKSTDKWDWDYAYCDNSESCWGPRVKLFEIRRSKSKWMMTQKSQAASLGKGLEMLCIGVVYLCSLTHQIQNSN